MKKRLFCIILLLSCFVAVPLSAWAAGEVGDGFAAAENRLLALMNAARKNPIQAMIDNGIDPDAVLAARPEDADDLVGGMPPLAPDVRLRAAARAHTLDMLTVNFYGHVGSNGSSYEERIEAQEYKANDAGESLGFIAFFNYMNPVLAAENIFKNMLRDELDPNLERPLNILNPDMADAGIGLGSGQVVIDERGYNAYMVTCDFGTDVTENITGKGAESTLLILINQARMRPLDVAAALGVDVESIRVSDPERYARWAGGMPPVGKNEHLTAAAAAHTREMAVHAYVSHGDRSEKNYPERIADSGYDADASVGERLGFRLLGDAAMLSEEIQRLFEAVMHAEFAAPAEAAVILNPLYREVGIGLALSALPIDGDLKKSLILTVDSGYSSAAEQGAEGWVYRDLDGDGLYSMGEGVFGIPVNVVGYERTPGEWIPTAVPYDGTTTDGAGRFSLAEVTKMLQVWADTEYRVLGNIENEYRDLVFAWPGDIF